MNHLKGDFVSLVESIEEPRLYIQHFAEDACNKVAVKIKKHCLSKCSRSVYSGLKRRSQLNLVSGEASNSEFENKHQWNY